MRRVVKSNQCPSLAQYVALHPHGRWEDYRNFNSGTNYSNTRELLFSDQEQLCAYCEVKVNEDMPHHRRVEHFNSKSASTPANNLHLQWSNLLAVCISGSDESSKSKGYQLPANLSCDSHKDSVSNRTVWTGEVLFPPGIPARSELFCFEMRTGKLLPNLDECQRINIIPNNHSSTAELVEETIRVFNLNCDRLCSARLRVAYEFEHRIKKTRETNDKSYLENLLKQWRGLKQFQTVRDILMHRAKKIVDNL